MPTSGKCLTLALQRKFPGVCAEREGFFGVLAVAAGTRRAAAGASGAGLRITVAAILSLVAAQLLGLPLPLWAVLTAMIVTQMSVGRSLKATGDYLVGTVGGAIYGGLVAILIPHESELSLLIVLVIAVAPLALLAAGASEHERRADHRDHRAAAARP